jgi:hypothetical protein
MNSTARRSVFLPRFKNETQGCYVKPNLNIEEVVASACEDAMREGLTQWKGIRASVTRSLEERSPEDRDALENALRMMVSREEDQFHNVVKH